MPISNDDDKLHPAEEVMVTIHGRIDMGLVTKLTDTVRAYIAAIGHPIKTNVVSATFAYMLADAISQADNHDRICQLSETYGEYVHRCAHGMQEQHEEIDNDENTTVQ